jgi:hypothetical protein
VATVYVSGNSSCNSSSSSDVFSNVYKLAVAATAVASGTYRSSVGHCDDG